MIPVSWVQECEKLDIRRYPDGRTPQNIEMARSERRLSLVTRNLEESSRTIDQRIL
jgi:hypothetical protein